MPGEAGTSFLGEQTTTVLSLRVPVLSKMYLSHNEGGEMNRQPVLTKGLIATTRTERARKLNPKIDREYIVPILMKSVAILELLKETPGGLKISQIQAQTGVALSTIYRIVRTFVASGYLELSEKGFYTAR